MKSQLTDLESDPELGLRNPYSKATCMIIYMYSMELGGDKDTGTSPFYAEFNKAIRDNDFTNIKIFGPFARALSHITYSAERKRELEDKIESGKNIVKNSKTGGALYNMAGSFLVWRGS